MSGQQRDLDAFYRRNAMLGSSERYRQATAAELYYLGRQYDHLKDWNDRSVPLEQRRPRIVVPLFKDAIDTLARFVWGGHRFPSVSIPATWNEGDSENDVGPLLDHEEAQLLTRFARALVETAELERCAKEFARKALTTTSVAVIVGINEGFVKYHVEDGKHCTPKWHAYRPGELESIEILYQYPREEQTSMLKSKTTLVWYRRVIDTQRDVVYQEVPVAGGQVPDWKEDPEKTVEHKLGWCPVRWIRTLPDQTDAIDGRPVIDPQLYPIIDDVCYTVSQRSRAVRYGCDPQLVRKGFTAPEKEQTKQKSPGIGWDVAPDGDVKFLEIVGSGVQRATEHINDMIAAFREAAAVVKADPDETRGDISGVVLELLHQPMIALASDLRADLGDKGFAGIVQMAMRLCHDVRKRGERVWIQGIDAATLLLDQCLQEGQWMHPKVCLHWAPWFDITVAEQRTKVETAERAKKAGLVSAESATRYLEGVFGVEDVGAELEAVDAGVPDPAAFVEQAIAAQTLQPPSKTLLQRMFVRLAKVFAGDEETQKKIEAEIMRGVTDESAKPHADLVKPAEVAPDDDDETDEQDVEDNDEVDEPQE
jgi:hypothetical protein